MVYIARVWLGLILLMAGVLKLWDRRAFRQVVRQFDVVPPGASGWLAWVLPIIELAVGGALVLSVMPGLAALAAAALLLLFTAALWVNLLNGHTDVSCGCFGRHSPRLHWSHVWANGVLLGIAVFVVLSPDAFVAWRPGVGDGIELSQFVPRLPLLAVSIYAALMYQGVGELITLRDAASRGFGAHLRITEY